MPEFFQVSPKPEWNFSWQHELKGIQNGLGDTGAKSLLVFSPSKQDGMGLHLHLLLNPSLKP